MFRIHGFRNGPLGFLVIAAVLSACASSKEKQPEEKQTAGGAGTTEEQVALGEKRESAGKSAVTHKEEVVVERETQVPTIRSTSIGADVNRMNIEQFTALGFPQEVARNIVAYRNEHGPFGAIDELKAVPGMNETLFQAHAGKLAVKSGEVLPKG